MARLPLLRLFSLAIRQLLRDARAGELRVLFFALVVAVAASTAITAISAAVVATWAAVLVISVVERNSIPALSNTSRIGARKAQ